MGTNRIVKLNELESQQVYGPDYDFDEGICHGAVYGWDILNGKGFDSMEEAFNTMDDKIEHGSLWRINHKTYMLLNDNGTANFIEVEVKII